MGRSKIHSGRAEGKLQSNGDKYVLRLCLKDETEVDVQRFRGKEFHTDIPKGMSSYGWCSSPDSLLRIQTAMTLAAVKWASLMKMALCPTSLTSKYLPRVCVDI